MRFHNSESPSKIAVDVLFLKTFINDFVLRLKSIFIIFAIISALINT